MSGITSLRASTANAAQKALDAGVIAKDQFARMTDGTVSLQDISNAKTAMLNAAGTDNENVARELFNAVTAQNQAQSSVTSIKEGLKDAFGGGMSRDIVRNIK